MELFTFKITVHMPILHCSWDMNSARGAELKKKKNANVRESKQSLNIKTYAYSMNILTLNIQTICS